jgi:hypothetical protein
MLAVASAAMAVFLSADWIAALDDAARSSKTLAAQTSDVTLTIEQVVRAAPGGDVRYHIVIDRGAVRVQSGAAATPDLTFITEYGSACALASGRANVQEELVRGRFKVTGRIDRVAAHESALDALDDVFATVRASTSYPPQPPS